MQSGIRHNFCRVWAAMAVLATGALVGCNNSAAPVEDRTPMTARMQLHAAPADGNLLVNPLTQMPWRYADWTTLGAPADQTPTTPTTHVAVYYAPKTLYVAFACDLTADPATSGTVAAPANSDHVQVWLDTSAAQNGTEYICIAVASNGQATASWYRATVPPRPREDGSPDYTHPITRIPDYTVPGLKTVPARGQFQGTPAWGVVVAVPLEGLPLPLKAQAKAGEHWRVNLIRMQWRHNEVGDGGQQALAQSNLAPVYGDSQQAAPYRMAELVLGAPGQSSVAFKTTE